MKRVGVLALFLLGGCLAHDPYYNPPRYHHYSQPYYHRHYHRPVCHTHYQWNPYTHRYYPRRICYWHTQSIHIWCETWINSFSIPSFVIWMIAFRITSSSSKRWEMIMQPCMMQSKTYFRLPTNWFLWKTTNDILAILRTDSWCWICHNDGYPLFYWHW